MTRETLVYDHVAGEVVTKDVLARREAKRPKKKICATFLPDRVQRGSWVWDPERQKIVTKADYYARNPVRHRGEGLQVVPDIQDYRATKDGSVISGRRQHREYLKRNGFIEYGNEKPTNEIPDVAPVAPDIKDAIEFLEAGHPAPVVEGVNERKFE